MAYFNPRSPDGERPRPARPRRAPRMISIHAPRMGSDRVRPRCRGLLGDFNPRSPDGERPCVLAWQPPCLRISIHAPRMGSDRDTLQYRLFATISIHAPRMGSDPLWYTRLSPCSYFNPRSPDGERLSCVRDNAAYIDISIHAPRMGSDRARARRPQLMAGYFNPRSPDGERPRPGRTRPGRIPYFNPRSPDGERPTIPITATALYTFQSTLPGWGATYPIYDETHRSDLFQSTLPGWGATC